MSSKVNGCLPLGTGGAGVCAKAVEAKIRTVERILSVIVLTDCELELR